MSYDKATVRVSAENDGVVDGVREVVDEVHDSENFIVEVVDESYDTSGSGADGSKVLTVEVHEYVGEIPLFTAKVRENVEGAEVADVDVERGASEVPAANEE